MKKTLCMFIFLVIVSLGFLSNVAFAIPTLQLDIEGGTYDEESQTIIAPADSFTLYAYLKPDLKEKNTVMDWYYISAAVVPKTGPTGSDGGSFTFDFGDGGVRTTPLPGDGNNTIEVTDEMVYGFPPLETIVDLQGWDKGDLKPHGIFETYFAEFGFQFTGAQISPYNTQDRAISGDPIPDSGNGMYYAAFTIDTSNLLDGYTIHFDLYNKKLKNCTLDKDCDITQFAPFSHDAESKKVPEPSTLILLGTGLVALSLWRLKKGKG
ncbi:MAG TPA: hypothetical protein DDX84_09295 [Nitrospiraceae bacterium]|nr:hypothetical protein [Nitrospiraceae bacterium]